MASKILLADDSITIQKVVNLTFADEGIEVIAVSNGELAQRRLPEINPDLVLADIFMPGKNGYELCDFIKQSAQFRHIPVVLLVGAFEPFDPTEARRVQADHHLTKPFESRTLVETVRALIGKQGRPATGPLASAPRPSASVPETRPLTTPPFNIDLAAMTDEWPAPAEAQAEHQAPQPASGEATQGSPFDLSAFGDQPSPREEDFGFDFRKLTEDADSTPDSTEPIPVATPTEGFGFSLIDAEPATEVKKESGGVSSVVPSTFGSVAQELVLDFETMQAPPAPQTESTEWFEAESESGQNAPVAFDFNPDEEEVQPAPPPVSASAFPAGELETLDETGFSFAEPTEAETAASSVLGAEDPLGDLLDENIEAEASPDVLTEEFPPGFGAPPHEFVAGDAPFGSNGNASPELDTAAQVDPSLESFAEEVAAEGEKLDSVFTSSEMWSREEARFAPIDVEAVAVDEPAPAPAAAEEFDEAETGFAFQPADAEEAIDEEEAWRARQHLPGEAVPDTASPARAALPQEVIDEIVRRVVAQLGDSVVREIAWEVVPDCVERVVETLARDSLSKRI
ncbi:MAG TPA: response regulator [Blastocatellia bacterium]|nr:response regulator [Blastocatellia bacterium]